MMDEQLINKIKEVEIDWDKEALWDELEPQLPRPGNRFPWRSILMSTALVAMLYCGRQSVAKFYSSEETLLVDETANDQGKSDGQTEDHSLANPQELHASSVKPGGSAINKHNSGSNEETTTAIDLEEGRFSTAIVFSGEDSIYVSSTIETIDDGFYTHQNSDTNIAANLNNSDATKAPSLSPALLQSSLPDKVRKKGKESGIADFKREDLSSDFEKNQLRQEEEAVLDNNRPLAVLPSRAASTLEEDKKLDLISRIAPVQSKNKEIKTGLFIGLSAGMGMLSRSVKTNVSDPAERMILLDNKASEHIRFNTLTALDIGYQMKRGLFFQSGLNYSEKQEQLNWQEVVAMDTSEFFNNRAYFSLDEFGDTTFYSGRSERTETVERELRHWNKLKTYELPLVVGYSRQHKKMNYEASVGLLLNLSRQFEGRIIDVDKQVVDNPEVTLRNNIDLGYTVAIGLGYQIIGKHQVFVSSSYRRSPWFSVLSTEQHYHSLNIQLGFRAFLSN